MSSTTVLTAAHCKTDVSLFSVVVGDYDVTTTDSGEQSITPQEWINHPNYNEFTTDNDFAIIQLSSPVTFSSTVSPICLPSTSDNYENTVATVTGWGTLAYQGSVPNILQKVVFSRSSKLTKLSSSLFR